MAIFDSEIYRKDLRVLNRIIVKTLVRRSARDILESSELLASTKRLTNIARVGYHQGLDEQQNKIPEWIQNKKGSEENSYRLGEMFGGLRRQNYSNEDIKYCFEELYNDMSETGQTDSPLF